jgi:hypothetical protein
MKETEERTKGIFKGRGIWCQEACDTLAELFRDLFGNSPSGNGTSSS